MPQVTSNSRIEQIAMLVLLALSGLAITWALVVAATDVWLMLAFCSD